jgi:hypothetical protein
MFELAAQQAVVGTSFPDFKMFLGYKYLMEDFNQSIRPMTGKRLLTAEYGII